MDDKTHAVGELMADPLADDTIARIVGNWSTDSNALNAEQFAALAETNRHLASWVTNGDLLHWPPSDLAHTATPHIVKALKKYLDEAVNLPEWAHAEEIARAEQVFFENGPVSCAILFCASLPECYVLPDLADVLHAAGQLEKHTDYRIRSTAAMIFPVMSEGGLTSPEGSGVAQILKVRLIHATIRNLILRGNPQLLDVPTAQNIPPLAASVGSTNPMFTRLFEHGWNISARGLPCNQNELAYTLLTFGYVFLRAMRQLRADLTPADEHAVLHTWNVVGHLLGIERARMAKSMNEAQLSFAQFQRLGTEPPRTPDVRPALGKALIDTMEASLPWPIIRHLPAYLTTKLCGVTTAQSLGVDTRVPIVVALVFKAAAALVGLIDWAFRRFTRGFSLSKLLVHLFGIHAVEQILLSESRPLQLPSHILNAIKKTHSRWQEP